MPLASLTMVLAVIDQILIGKNHLKYSSFGKKLPSVIAVILICRCILLICEWVVFVFLYSKQGLDWLIDGKSCLSRDKVSNILEVNKVLEELKMEYVRKFIYKNLNLFGLQRVSGGLGLYLLGKFLLVGYGICTLRWRDINILPFQSEYSQFSV